ncbi:histidine-containing phosphotransfer protein 1-like isoform X2 [Tripterygium wilfordii]|uniref:histidine-containing phosphotransfer protein 1-like isoform X2 n=1 Tax=Tripterygium wilfordii TaxID=458696 RepID=UPI0018F805EA|nr:histidine-containing phosphotransfer protein 1-like isoform X2 [Tripterygium wilfordii]
MELGHMQRTMVDYKKSLFMEGFLDDQFSQLQQLQDESNPDFVIEVVSLFFEDSERILNDLSSTLAQPSVDFKKVDANVHQLKGSSSRCLRCLQQVKQEYYLVKNNLETLFRLEQQIVAAGGAVPTMEMSY